MIARGGGTVENGGELSDGGTVETYGPTEGGWFKR
jgi:hypothetical protein